MAQVRGIRTTKNILQDRREFDFTGIHLLEPNQTPLTAILSQLRKRSCFNPEYNWFEDALIERFDRINNTAGYAATDVALTVDDASIFLPNDILHVTRTGENMLVTAVDSSLLTITVTRGIGGTTAASLVDNDEIVAIGTTFEEGSSIPTAVTTKVAKVYNYTQIFKRIVEFTNTEKVSKMRGQQDEQYQIQKVAKEYSRDVERAFLFGSRNEGTGTAGNPRRQTGGLTEFITTNVSDNSGGSLTQAVLDAWLRDIFAFGGSSTRTVFGSPLFMQRVTDLSTAKLDTQMGQNTFGLSITRYISPYGVINMIMHRELKGDVYGSYAIALDLNNVWYRFLNQRDTMLKMNVQDDKDDKTIHEWIGEVGLEIRHQTTHGIIKNFA